VDFERWLRHLGRIVGPLLNEIPPKLGSKRPTALAAERQKLAERLAV